MGLFSKKKSEPQATGIPAEYLEAVSVNGSPVAAQPTPVVSATVPEPASPSPFLETPGLQPSTSTSAPTTPSKIPLTVHEVAERASTMPTPAPTPVPTTDGAIHFNDDSAAPANLPVASGAMEAEKLPEKKMPDFSNIVKEPAIKNSEKAFPIPKTPKQSLFTRGNLISAGVFIIILALVIGGAWYYLNTRSVDAVPTENPGPDAASGTTPPPVSAPANTNISLNQANHLKIDVESVTPEDLRKLLEAQGQIMATANINEPVEYLVTDLDDNPISFSRFAFLAGASEPSDLVDVSDEGFSLYLVRTNGLLRIGLSVQLNGKADSSFPKNPEAVFASLKDFLYPADIQSRFPEKKEFKTSDYRNHQITYVNLDATTLSSFDFTSDQNSHTFTVSNSKDGLRAIIDKIENPLP